MRKSMTVKELIEKLKEFPEDMKVLSYEYFEICNVEKETPYCYDEECVIVN